MGSCARDPVPCEAGSIYQGPLKESLLGTANPSLATSEGKQPLFLASDHTPHHGEREEGTGDLDVLNSDGRPRGSLTSTGGYVYFPIRFLHRSQKDLKQGSQVQNLTATDGGTVCFIHCWKPY